MIGPISQERFERKFPGGVPNSDISIRRWFENSADRTLGFVAYRQKLQSWAAGILKKRKGQYEVWRQAAGLAGEREAVDALLRLFGLTDRGYRELLAEREFLGRPDGKMEFLIHAQWGFDPAYDQTTRDELDAPIEALVEKYFSQFYPELLSRLKAEPGQKSACSLQAFVTPHEVLGAPVFGMIYLVAGRDADPYLRVYVGRQEFIEERHNKVVEHLQTLGNRPGAVMRAILTEGFEP